MADHIPVSPERTPPPRNLTAVSLFAGVGGIDLALERAGVQVTAAVEIDAAARGVIATQRPDTALFNDVTKVTADDLRATGFVPERGIIAAGWPCQGNSVAGRRGGMADPRSGLWRHVVRLLAETRAAWFLGENVPGLLSVNDGDDYRVIVHDLGTLGYGGASRVLDAQFFGVPQRRRRVFFVGHLGDQRRPVEVLAEPESGGGNPATSHTTGARVAATLTAGTSRAGVSTPGRRQEDDVNLVVAALTANGVGTCGADDNQAHAGHLASTYRKAQRAHHADDCERWQSDHLADTLDAGGHTPRTATAVVTVTGDRTHALTSEGADASEDGTGRGTPIIADTLRSHPRPGSNSVGALAFHTGGNGVLSDTTVRRLTPLECERLQGFPDNWTALSNGKPQADSARYRQMGNAVAVPCVEWIAKRIVGVA